MAGKSRSGTNRTKILVVLKIEWRRREERFEEFNWSHNENGVNLSAVAKDGSEVSVSGRRFCFLRDGCGTDDVASVDEDVRVRARLCQQGH